MKRIYKYELPINGNIITIHDPIVKTLKIQEQNGIPMIWAMVDLDVTKTTEMDIISVGTGWDIPEECGKYLGTA